MMNETKSLLSKILPPSGQTRQENKRYMEFNHFNDIDKPMALY